jgi:hypothetical protein
MGYKFRDSSLNALRFALVAIKEGKVAYLGWGIDVTCLGVNVTSVSDG